MSKLFRYGIATVAVALLLAGCTSSTSTPQVIASAESRDKILASHQEYPIGNAQQFDSVQVVAIYGPPATMTGGSTGSSGAMGGMPGMGGMPATDANIHFEAEVTALPGNHLGFAAGSWIPYITIDYQITGPDGTVNKGTFMPMTGATGQHYGANEKIGAAGRYKVQYTLHSPADNGLMVHSDKTTGVDGQFWTSPLVASWDFDYLPRTW